jgi:hypothetical protein
MADESRNDAAMAQFKSRAQQPKTLAAGAGANAVAATAPIQLRVAFDHRCGTSDYGRVSMSDQIDASRWNYVGVSQLPRSCSGARRLAQASMCGTFEW